MTRLLLGADPAPAADGLDRFALHSWLIEQPAPSQAEIRESLALARRHLRATAQEITRLEQQLYSRTGF